MSKLYSIGELLIDFQSVGTGSLKDTKQFVKNAGGAPANVCVQVAKLGHKACYLSKVGKDGFGDFLIETLKNEGVDVSYIGQTDNFDTSLAFVSFGKDGEREFSFYRRTAADLSFTERDFATVSFQTGDILEFGSVALKTETAKCTHKYLIDKASKSGALVCFDPNLRFNLWEDQGQLRSVVREFLPYSDVVKVGLDELQFICGTEQPDVQSLFCGNTQLLLVTDGSKGATLYTKDGKRYHCNGYKVKAVDTTGAGDSFFGALIAGLMVCNATPQTLSDSTINFQAILDFACKCGAYTTTGYGAIPAMGDRQSVEKAVR